MSAVLAKLTRRNFLDLAAGAGASALAAGGSLHARQNGVIGANNRVRAAVIGSGTRGNMVAGFFLRHPAAQVVAACDVSKTRLDPAIERLTKAQPSVCLLAIHAIREGRTFKYDAAAHKAVAV